MNIKNLCIAFSQSIVRHNDANCETIKSDHVQQSLLVEIILTYVSFLSILLHWSYSNFPLCSIVLQHEWLFDLNDQMTENVPNEAKDIEVTLMQQQYSYMEPTNYTDVLANILRLIRNKWHMATSATHNGDVAKDNRQPINIQFRR
jgi:hypothetical protein